MYRTLNDREVRAIRAEYAAGKISQNKLAAKYGSNQGHIWAIVRGNKRQFAGGTPVPASVRNRTVLSEQSVRAIRADYKAGVASVKELAAKYGVAPTNVYAVVNRKSWKALPEVSREDEIFDWFLASWRKQVDPAKRLSDYDASRIFSVVGTVGQEAGGR
jgi:hypothetical protein